MQDDARKQTKSVLFQPEHWAKLDKQAEAKGLSTSALIRMIVLDWLTKQEEQDARKLMQG